MIVMKTLEERRATWFTKHSHFHPRLEDESTINEFYDKKILFLVKDKRSIKRKRLDISQRAQGRIGNRYTTGPGFYLL